MAARAAFTAYLLRFTPAVVLDFLVFAPALAFFSKAPAITAAIGSSLQSLATFSSSPEGSSDTVTSSLGSSVLGVGIVTVRARYFWACFCCAFSFLRAAAASFLF